MALLTDIRAYYKLDESSGNPVDATGNGYTLTNNNTVGFASGKINNAADFGASNTDKTLSVASALGIADDAAMSIAYWFKTPATLANFPGVLNYTQNGGISLMILLDHTNDRIVGISVGPGMNDNTNLGTFTPAVSTWYHFAVTFDGTDAQVYKDGSTFGSTYAVDVDAGASDNFMIGRNVDDFWFADGLIDEVGVWNRELTSAEITSLYNSGNGLQYPFGETADTSKMFLMF